MRRALHSLVALALAAVAAGCGRGEPRGAGQQVARPDTTAAAVWAHLQEANYRQTWQLWPGTDRLYAGGEPHGMLLTTYVNQAAHAAVTDRTGAMPVGAVVVKENYMPDSTLAAVTVMYKAEGYNPDHNDWFWIKRLADGTVEAAGRVEGCQNCHGARRDNDYILTQSLSGQ